ncbi:MAG: Dabb family protein [Verrucomicrobiales bacterium]|nr:Dabb family protein [Verrucomicrobiales bacterium]
MKRIVLSLIVAVFCAGLFSATTEAAEGQTQTQPRRGRRGNVVHVVSFKFKAEATEAQIKEVVDAFAALPEKIEEIGTFEWGTNISPENLNKGFTHCFTLTFQDAKARDAYLVHPAHKAFGGIVGPVLDDVFVIDYVANRRQGAGRGQGQGTGAAARN